jgi:type IV pilus assembly protein PilB
MIRNPEFLRLLVSKKLMTEEGLQRLKRKYEEDAFGVLMHLMRKNAFGKDVLGRLWGDSMGFAYIDPKSILFESHLVQLLPESFARKHHIIPIYQFGEALTVAFANPMDQFVIKDAEKLTGRMVSPVFAFPQDIEDAIEIEYKTEDNLRTLSSRIVTDTIQILDISELTKDELHHIAGSQAVVEFVNGLLLLAVREKASDIHIEPGVEQVRVRFRIDGLLQEKSRLENSLLAPLVSRLKIMGSMDITERRRPQDGRINLDLANRSIDFRFSSVPTIYGEKIVLRVLGQTQVGDVPDLTELNFSKSNFDMIKEGIEKPHGIFFVTGPTGSGKSTTLFSMLKYLNKPGVNITTIEEPVEYKLEGINQVQVNSGAELDFASAIKSFLRQDPDVILVGEIRDMETAQTACRAALTGHLVMGTMHTNTAVQAITRLTDIGVEPFIVAPSIIGVLSQRLVRRICDNCREKYSAPPDVVEKVFSRESRDIYFFRGKGCARCGNSGYAGRVAIHEMILVDKETRIMIARGGSVSEIQEYARKAGFQSMRYDGIKKVLRGFTTIEEVFRVTAADEETPQNAS